MIIDEMYIDASEVACARGRKPDQPFIMSECDWIIGLDFKNGKTISLAVTNKQWTALKAELQAQHNHQFRDPPAV